jgi:hypothetical protein
MTKQGNIVNNEKVIRMNIEINSQNWNISSLLGRFSEVSFLSDYTIKTIERIISLNNEYDEYIILYT